MTPSNEVGPDGPLLTVAEAAGQLRISVRTLRRLYRKDRIRHYKVGRQVRILQLDVTAYLASQEGK